MKRFIVALVLDAFAKVCYSIMIKKKRIEKIIPDIMCNNEATFEAINEPAEYGNRNGRTFAVFTLGCKVNQYETDCIREELGQRGFTEVEPHDCPDICIINTCMVTKEAARKSRQAIRRLRSFSPEARIYAIGCAAELPEDALATIPEEVVLVNNTDKEHLARTIADHFETVSATEPAPILRGRTRAHLKIQDGCDHFCTYCIIPHVRGRSRSREPEDILQELHQLEQQGYQEVILTGIHLGDYGKHIKSTFKLAELVEYLLDNSTVPRMRLSSLEPMDFSYDLLEVFRKHPRLARHLHLPLQHGSDRILKKMNRDYTLEDYARIVDTAVRELPDLAVTTDIIVGFPGETEEDFEIMYRYVESAPLFMLHVFPFSCHPRTPAAKMKETVPQAVKKDRTTRLSALGREKMHQFLDRYRNTTLEILVEQVSEDRMLAGHTPNYIEVTFPGDERLRGHIVTVKITERDGEVLYGKDPEPVRAGGEARPSGHLCIE